MEVHNLLQITLMLIGFSTVSPTVTVKFKFQSFENPNKKDWNGNKCDFSLTRPHCDHKFTFCFDVGNGSSPSIEICPLGKSTTTEFKNSERVNFPLSWRDKNGNRVDNPIRVNMDSWQNGIKLKVLVLDDDGTSRDDIVDKYANVYDGPAYGPGLDVDDTFISKTYMGTRTSSEATRITLHISVQCDHQFYGKYCDVYCPHSTLVENVDITSCSDLQGHSRLGQEPVVEQPINGTSKGSSGSDVHRHPTKKTDVTLVVAVVAVALLIIIIVTISIVVCVVRGRYKERKHKNRAKMTAILGNNVPIKTSYHTDTEKVTHSYEQRTYGVTEAPNSPLGLHPNSPVLTPGGLLYPNLDRQQSSQSNVYSNRQLPDIPPTSEANGYFDMNGVSKSVSKSPKAGIEEESKYPKDGIEEESIYCEMSDYEQPSQLKLPL